jgi:hypothetical protein
MILKAESDSEIISILRNHTCALPEHVDLKNARRVMKLTRIFPQVRQEI